MIPPKIFRLLFSLEKFVKLESTLREKELKLEQLRAIDNAMKNGFGLAFGPFELMDKLGKTWIKEKFLETNF